MIKYEGTILIHGGAGTWEISRLKAAEGVLESAAEAAYESLQKEGALKAVISAINVLENSPIFNAGYGSALNLLGEVEVDASVMTGDGRCGAIASVKGVKFAVNLAELVMRFTDHILLTSPTADMLAERHGLKVDPRDLIDLYRLNQWKKGVTYIISKVEKAEIQTFAEKDAVIRYIESKYPKLIEFLADNKDIIVHLRKILKDNGNTVGAVAFDGQMLAAATSTGGLLLKLPGRIGDTPLIGAGTYANNRSGAASATGIGEQIIKSSLTYTTVLHVGEYGAKQGVIETFKRLNPRPEAGVISIDNEGNWGIAHASIHMPCAVVENGDIKVKTVWERIPL
ncbi:MAG: isoaspartyl peptidase/L-asparaginase family protein [Candidatus Njordarchaeia archaeon]